MYGPVREETPMTRSRRALWSSAVMAMLLFASACTASTADSAADPQVDSEEVLIAALRGQLLADGAFRVGGGEAECVATGMVELLGAVRLAEIGVTAADPNGPDDDPYSGLTADELGDIVVVWDACTNVASLVTQALLSTSPDQVDSLVIECLEASLSAGLGARFLFAALNDVDSEDPSVADVLRVVDGCSAGALRQDLVGVAPGLWPWLSVDLPGLVLSVIDSSGPDAADLSEFLGGASAVDGLEAVAARVTHAETGELLGALIVASIESQRSVDDITVDDYVAGLVTSAADAEVFEFPLPSGVEVIGWEAQDEDLVFLIWPGERIVVFATGTLAAVDVLSLYSELVPTA